MRETESLKVIQSMIVAPLSKVTHSERGKIMGGCPGGALRLHQHRQDVALAKNFYFFAIDFDFSATVFAEQNLIANLDTDR